MYKSKESVQKCDKNVQNRGGDVLNRDGDVLNRDGDVLNHDGDVLNRDGYVQKSCMGGNESSTVSTSDGVLLLKGGISTRSAAFNTLIEQVERAASFSDAPILFLGPNGVGKSFLASKIAELCQKQGRMSDDFLEIYAAAVPDDFEWKTLGRSAFHGILYVREIEALSAVHQTKLLQFLDDLSSVQKSVPNLGFGVRFIASSVRNLRECVENGTFRADLYAKIQVWTFTLPPLAQRPEDILPILDAEIGKYGEFEKTGVPETSGSAVTFSKDAKQKFLRFATSSDALWSGNFRDLNASILRMTAFARAEDGTISTAIVTDEIARLKSQWAGGLPIVRVIGEIAALADDLGREILGAERWDVLDRFDRAQLADVLSVCRAAQSLSEAGRILFSNSRLEKRTSNDTDRLRKYLLKFNISWNNIHSDETSPVTE